MLATLQVNAARNQQDRLLRTGADAYGQRYVLDFPVTTATGSATVRSAWIVRTGQTVLRFLACYVL